MYRAELCITRYYLLDVNISFPTKYYSVFRTSALNLSSFTKITNMSE